MAECTGAEVLVKALRNEGVEKIFGISGHGITILLEAIRKENGLNFISTKHEENAAHMADGWARATGEIGVCVSTVGSGAVNLVAGLYEAYTDSIPVLAITANVQSFISYPFMGALEELDAITLYKPVTKWNAVVHDPHRLAELVHRAFREARSGKPGPVHLDIPLDLLWEPVPVMDLPSPKIYRSTGRVRGDADNIERAAELIKSAEKPLLIAGGGVISSCAWKEFGALADALDAPATTTPMGSGCLTVNQDNFFGDSGWIGGDAVIQALNEADVLLAVGCKFSSWLGLGRPPIMVGAPIQKIIHVDIDPREIGKNVGVAVGIVGDAKTVLIDMLSAIERNGTVPKGKNDWKHTLSSTYKKYMDSLEPMLGDSSGPITQARLAKEVGNYLQKKDAKFVIDGGSTFLWASTYLQANKPRQRFFWAGGGHLGIGLPFANALKFANPDDMVINFCGDGAFGMTMQELDTAVRHKLPVINIINNDGGWGMCKAGQLFLYGEEACDGIDQDFGPVNYAAVAEGFGCYGEQVESVEDIIPAIERALNSGKTAVLDVKVKPVLHPMFAIMAAVVLQGCKMPPPKGMPPQV